MKSSTSKITSFELEAWLKGWKAYLASAKPWIQTAVQPKKEKEKKKWQFYYWSQGKQIDLEN
jgi:hypothetical protein